MDKNILNYIFTTLLNFNNESNTKKIIKLSKKKDIIEGFQTDEEEEEPKNEEPKNDEEEPKNDEDAPASPPPKKTKKKKADEDKPEKPEKTEKPKKVKKGRKKLCLGKTCMVETDLKKILESIQDK